MFNDDDTARGRIIRFIIYVIIGFGCALLFRYLKK